MSDLRDCPTRALSLSLVMEAHRPPHRMLIQYKETKFNFKKSPRKRINLTTNVGGFTIYESGYYYFCKYPVLVKFLVSATSYYKEFYNLLPIITIEHFTSQIHRIDSDF